MLEQLISETKSNELAVSPLGKSFLPTNEQHWREIYIITYFIYSLFYSDLMQISFDHAFYDIKIIYILLLYIYYSNSKSRYYGKDHVNCEYSFGCSQQLFVKEEKSFYIWVSLSSR